MKDSEGVVEVVEKDVEVIVEVDADDNIDRIVGIMIDRMRSGDGRVHGIAV